MHLPLPVLTKKVSSVRLQRGRLLDKGPKKRSMDWGGGSKDQRFPFSANPLLADKFFPKKCPTAILGQKRKKFALLGSKNRRFAPRQNLAKLKTTCDQGG